MKVKRLRELLDYDPKTGEVRWKVDRGGRRLAKSGDVAGCMPDKGYAYVRTHGQKLYIHRIAWALTHGYWPKEIDHIDGDPSNNRLKNLRAATHRSNVAAAHSWRRNGELPRGVYKASRNTFWSKIRVKGRNRYLGAFPTADAASAAFMRAHREAHGVFSNL